MNEQRRIIDFRTAAARLQAEPLPSAIPARTYIPDWERSLVALERRPRGVQKYVWTAHRILLHLGGDTVTMADITHEVLNDYIEHEAARGCQPSTRINDLAVMRSFSKWAIRKGLRTDDPTEGIQRPKKPLEAPEALVDGELDALIAAINAMPEHLTAGQRWRWQRNRLAIIVIVLTGLRLSELADLRWGDLLMKQRSLKIRCGKGGKAGVVSMCDELIAELEAVPAAERHPDWAVIPRVVHGPCAGQPMTDDGIEHIFDSWLVKVVKIDKVRAHRLRHTFATELLFNNVDLRRIQLLLRHENLNTTQRYLLVRNKDLDAAVNTLTLKRPDTAKDEE